MLSKEELLKMLGEVESDRVERTVSTSNTDKFSEAICAFANDFPNHKLPGYLIIGADDKSGAIKGVTITDQLLQNLTAIRNNGQVLPQPALTVQKYIFEEGELAVVEVFPSPHPPVRYKGNVWIRTGPVKVLANEVEEKILIEKRTASSKTFDALPAFESTINDLDVEAIKSHYIKQAIAEEVLEKNHRGITQQIASLRLFDMVKQTPTNAGILLFGTNPLYFFPGAYIQYVKFSGNKISINPKEKTFKGALVNELKNLDDFIRYNIIEQGPRRGETMQEQVVYNYPYWAVRELLMNAIMHRNYESNAPIYINHFADKIEIINSGGLYGEVRPDNFPFASDYRNPILAEAMKILGYVNRFNYGVRQAQVELEKNGNPPAEFKLDLITKFMVTIRVSEQWV